LDGFLTILYPLLTLHFPGGPKAAFGSAVACGILLGVFEGVGVLLGRVFSEGTRPQLPPCEFSLFHSCRITTQTSALQYPNPCPHNHRHLLSSSQYLLSFAPSSIMLSLASFMWVHLDVGDIAIRGHRCIGLRGPLSHTPHSVYNHLLCR